MKFTLLSSIAFITCLPCSLSAKLHDPIKPKEQGVIKKHQHPHEQLKHFILGEITFNKLNFEQSLKVLQTEYAKTCVETNDTPLLFNYHINGNEKQILDMEFTIEGSYQYILNQLCAIYGMKVTQKANVHTFTPYPADETITTKTIRVPPDYESGFSKLGKVVANEELSVRFDQARSQLSLRGNAKAVAKMEAFSKNIFSLKPIQVKMRSHIIGIAKKQKHTLIDELLKEENRSIDPQVLAKRLKLQENEQYTIGQLASVVCRLRETASLVRIREGRNSVTNLSDEKLWEGIKLDYTPTRKGMQIIMVSKPELRIRDKASFNLKGFTSEEFDEQQITELTKLKTITNPSSFQLHSGATHLTPLVEASPDYETYLMTQVDLINVTGQPILPENAP